MTLTVAASRQHDAVVVGVMVRDVGMSCSLCLSPRDARALAHDLLLAADAAEPTPNNDRN